MPETPNRESEMQRDASSKKEQWQKIVEEIERTADGLGYSIEKGIFDVVVGLNATGFLTRQSCEGHVDWGRISPWIDIVNPGEPAKQYNNQDQIYQEIAKESGIPAQDIERAVDDTAFEAWLKAQGKLDAQGYTFEYQEWLKKNVELAKRVHDLVNEYNKDKGLAGNIRIMVEVGKSDVTIYNGGEDYGSQEKQRTQEEKEKLGRQLEEYRKEFKKFAEFLEKKFFEEKKIEAQITPEVGELAFDGKYLEDLKKRVDDERVKINRGEI